MMVRAALNYWLRRYGESFQAGGQSYRGIFFQPPSGLLRWLFAHDELESLARPLWAVAVAPSVNPPQKTTLLWRGTSYRVLHSIEFRMNDTAVYRLLLLEPVV